MRGAHKCRLLEVLGLAYHVLHTHDWMSWLFAQEYNDTMLTVYMASVTKGLSALHDVIDKFNVAYDRSGPQRRRGGF
jgi:Maintenance of mitochondrial structure and function